ncbi:hypothetical protein E2C01_058797 [Portunus trituberculatus]|uniref:Uncharacterized protein n=1 Tax=Portunus trituberculatus TaxID=210409 RepID=A0A5B7H5Q2_PORTR|nr:hypothetical protein [Portunus trituberculatus]
MAAGSSARPEGIANANYLSQQCGPLLP